MAANDEAILNPVTPPTPAVYRLNQAELILSVPIYSATDIPVGEEIITFSKAQMPLLSGADRQAILAAARIMLRFFGRIS